MPYVDPSWRMYPQWRWLSRSLCAVGIHHWLKSRTLKANIACAVCSKKTKKYEEYKRRIEGSKKDDGTERF